MQKCRKIKVQKPSFLEDGGYICAACEPVTIAPPIAAPPISKLGLELWADATGLTASKAGSALPSYLC